MISCKNQVTKIYQFNGYRFVETPVQFTKDALNKGVAKLRSYTTTNDTYIIVANSEMYGEAYNIFRPRYKKKRDLDQHAIHLLQVCESKLAELKSRDLKPLLDKANVSFNGSSQLH